ncbi:MAG TPA: hypothetical protein VFN76_09170 [Candidatus Limnocylindria bacterium]|nr:hypothetical protein [Candidatus Limnocylindria bacterium]
MDSDRFRILLCGASLTVGAVALLAAQLVRPDHGEDAGAILRAVAAGGGAAGAASLLYLVAAVGLAIGLVAIPGAVRTGRGARLLVASTALTAVGALWFAVEAALMRFVDVLAAASDTAGAAAQLDALNAGFGLVAVLAWFFYLAPLGVAVALWRAGATGSWLIGLWVISFGVGFAANSPLGASVPALVTANDVLLSVMVIGIASAIVRRAGRVTQSRGEPAIAGA